MPYSIWISIWADARPMAAPDARHPLDERDVVGRRHEPCPVVADRLEELRRERQERAVHLRPRAIGDGAWFVIGALDQADGGSHGQQPLDVGRCPVQVGLEADAHVRVAGARPLIEGDGRARVGAALHVDPDPAAPLGGVAREAVEVLEGDRLIEVETELGELERDLDVEAAGGDLIEERVVRVGDHLRLRKVREVLAQQREDPVDAPPLVDRRGRQGVLRRLAGHEASGRAPHPPESGQPILQPTVASRPEEHPAHGADGTDRPGCVRAESGESVV